MKKTLLLTALLLPILAYGNEYKIIFDVGGSDFFSGPGDEDAITNDIELSGPNNLEAGDNYTYTISNYDSNKLYSATTSLGKVSVIDDTLELDLTEQVTSATANITISNDDVSTDYSYNVAPDSTIELEGPSDLEAGGSYTYTISNYNSQYNYTATSTFGNTTISNNTLTLDLTNKDSSGTADITISNEDAATDYSYDVAPDPTIELSGPSNLEAGSSYTYTISNYDSNQNYSSTTSLGYTNISGETLTLDLTEQSSAGTADVTVTNDKTSTNFSFTVESAPVNFGTTAYISYNKDGAIDKVNSDGDVLWTFTGHSNAVHDIEIGPDGNIHSASNDSTIKKIDSEGNELWSFEGHTGRITTLEVANSGEVYTASYDGTVKKIDSNGDEVWSRTLSTASIEDEMGNIVLDNNGYIYVSAPNYTVKKLSSSGNDVWTSQKPTGRVLDLAHKNGSIYIGDGPIRKITTYDSESWTVYPYWSIYDIGIDSNNNVYGASQAGDPDNIYKYNSQGDLLWREANESIHSLTVGPNDNIYVGHYGDDEAFIRKYDSNGNTLWKKSYSNFNSNWKGQIVDIEFVE